MSRIRTTFIVVAWFWAIASVALAYLLRHHSVAMWIVGGTVAATGIALWTWSKRGHGDAAIRMTWFGLVAGVIIISSLITRDWVSLLLVGWFVWIAREYIIDVVGAGDQARPVCVNATGLVGVVEYDSMQFSGILVEECSPDWRRQFAQVKTDSAGCFELPNVSDETVHYLRISWPGTRTVYLCVTINADAQPLLVHLKALKPKTVGDWGSD